MSAGQLVCIIAICRLGKDGLDLVVAEFDPSDRRTEGLFIDLFRQTPHRANERCQFPLLGYGVGSVAAMLVRVGVTDWRAGSPA